MKIAMPGPRRTLAVAVAAVGVLAVAGAGYPAFAAGHHRVPGVRLVTPQDISRHQMGHGLEEVIVMARGTVGTGTAGALRVTCPNGYMAAGGGAAVGTLPAPGLPRGIRNAYLTADQAVPHGPRAPISWLGMATNLSGRGAALTVQAVCIRMRMPM